MGATYLSLQLRTSDRDAVLAGLRALAAAVTGSRQEFFVGEPVEGWLAVFPNFTPETERVAKALSARVDCLVLLLLSFDEDDLYCMFFRGGKALPWFKVSAGRRRAGKERRKVAEKLEVLADVCDAEGRARLVEALCEAGDMVFSSDLLQAFCDATGIRNAFTSFDYLQRGEREGLTPRVEPAFVTA